MTKAPYSGQRSKILPRMILMGLSTLFALLCADSVVRSLPSIPSAHQRRLSMANEQGLPFDTRDQLDLIRDLRREGIVAYPKVTVSAILAELSELDEPTFLPVSGIAQVATASCNETGVWTVYESDAFGFNNDPVAWEQPEHRVMLVGDSFTNGACVGPDEDLVRRLRQLGYNTISVGSGDNGPMLELASLREYGRALAPKIILWFYFEGNDVEDFQRELQVPLLHRYLDPSFTQNLVLRQREVNEFLIGVSDRAESQAALERERAHQASAKWRRDQANRSWIGYIKPTVTLYHLRSFVTERMRNARSHHGMLERQQLEQLEQVFKTAKGDAATLDAPLVVVYLPSIESASSSHRATHEEVLKILNRLQIPVLDFQPDISQKKKAFFPFGIGPHYSASGYDVLAQTIATQVLAAHVRPSLER